MDASTCKDPTIEGSFTTIFRELDEAANVLNTTLEDALLSPIGGCPVPIIEDDDDDDMSEELRKLDCSVLSLQEELHCSMISTTSRNNSTNDVSVGEGDLVDEYDDDDMEDELRSIQKSISSLKDELSVASLTDRDRQPYQPTVVFEDQADDVMLRQQTSKPVLGNNLQESSLIALSSPLSDDCPSPCNDGVQEHAHGDLSLFSAGKPRLLDAEPEFSPSFPNTSLADISSPKLFSGCFEDADCDTPSPITARDKNNNEATVNMTMNTVDLIFESDGLIRGNRENNNDSSVNMTMNTVDLIFESEGLIRLIEKEEDATETSITSSLPTVVSCFNNETTNCSPNASTSDSRHVENETTPLLSECKSPPVLRNTKSTKKGRISLGRIFQCGKKQRKRRKSRTVPHTSLQVVEEDEPTVLPIVQETIFEKTPLPIIEEARQPVRIPVVESRLRRVEAEELQVVSANDDEVDENCSTSSSVMGPPKQAVRKLVKMLGVANNRKKNLEVQNKKLVRLIGKAWQEKQRTQHLHHVQTNHIIKTMQSKRNVAEQRCKELETENTKLKSMVSIKQSRIDSLEKTFCERFEGSSHFHLLEQARAEVKTELQALKDDHVKELKAIETQLRQAITMNKARLQQRNSNINKGESAEKKHDRIRLWPPQQPSAKIRFASFDLLDKARAQKASQDETDAGISEEKEAKPQHQTISIELPKLQQRSTNEDESSRKKKGEILLSEPTQEPSTTVRFPSKIPSAHDSPNEDPFHKQIPSPGDDDKENNGSRRMFKISRMPTHNAKPQQPVKEGREKRFRFSPRASRRAQKFGLLRSPPTSTSFTKSMR